MIFNAITSLFAVRRWSKRVNNVPSSGPVDEFFDNRFPDSHMERIFANMEFDTDS